MKKFLFIFFITMPSILCSNDFNGWKSISTDHFTYIFEDFDENTAFELASYGEEIYGLINSFFDYAPENITVYINSRVDSPNGNFYPIPGSIDLYPVYPLNSENTTGSRSWLYELFLHEVVHYIHLEDPRGFFGALSRIFGKDLASASGAFLPAWYIEGIAVYLESYFTAGGRGTNRYFEAFTKAAAMENNYPSIYQIAYSSSFPPYNRIYSVGYILIKHMIEHYGEDIYQRIYNRYVKFPFFGPFSAIKKETGKSLHEIYEDMKEEQIDSFSKIFRETSTYKSESIQNKYNGDRSHPVMTERGLLYYRKARDTRPAIVALDSRTGREEVLVEAALMDSSSFSADNSGLNIVFASPEYELYHSYGRFLGSRLYITEEGKTRNINNELSLFQPAISPDGSRILAVMRKGSYSLLVEVDKDNGSIRELYKEDEINVMNPSFSPDGKEAVFTVNNKGMQDIYIMPLDNPSDCRPLFANDRSMDYLPRFVDDQNISFISDRDDDLSLFIYNIEKKTLSQLFRDPVGIADACLSDDTIYYQSYRTEGYEIRKGEISEQNIAWETESESLPEKSEWLELPRKTHMDLAIPYLWLPKPYVENSSSQGLLWGAGAAVFAGSYNQSTTWLLDLNFMPEPGQIEGSFEYDRSAGQININYMLEQSFNELIAGSSYIWRQETDQTLLLSYPLLEKTDLSWRHVLKHYLYGKHLLQFTQEDTFSISDSFSSEGLNYIHTGTGISLNNYEIFHAPTALFGGLSIYNQLDASFLLPLLDSLSLSYVLKESGSLRIPLSQRGTNLLAAWEGAYHNGNLSSSAVQARGWNGRLIPSDFSVYYSLGLQIPIALLDWGLPFGFNVQNLAAALNVEGISHFEIEGGSFNEYFASAELMGTYGYNYGSMPFGAGFSFRFYPDFDWRVYFFLSFDSLRK